MTKLKCWKKQWDHTKSYGSLVYKNNHTEEQVSVYPTSKKDVWVDSLKEGKRKIISTNFSLKSGKNSAIKYMKKHDKC